MTRPTEYDLVGMEQRARWLLDGVVIQRTELDRREELANSKSRPTRPEYQRVDTQEAIARDVLALVCLVRQK